MYRTSLQYAMFSIVKNIKGALGRAAVLETVRVPIETPAFVAVGTKATVKALTPVQIKETGAQVVLGNTYHLYLEPGEKIVEHAGGLGAFMGWNGTTMTDSGGFQVFSLGAAFGQTMNKVRGVLPLPLSKGRIEEGLEVSTTHRPSLLPPSRQFPLGKGEREGRGRLVSIDEAGVTFSSYRDGSEHRFTPEKSIEIQHALGADIMFAFDECTSPDAPYAYQKEAAARTHKWAARCIAAHQQPTTDNQQLLFGIVQGGRFEDLRKESAKTIGAMSFDGFGIGGSFDKEDMGTAVRWVNELLPEEKPRHLLGIGNPLDMFEAVEQGCDLFDCVAPTREARTGALYTAHGRINIGNTKYKSDFSPIEPDCACYTCSPRDKGGAGLTKAYLAHLFRSGEILANTLATIHNVYFTVQLVKRMRQGILDDSFPALKETFTRSYRPVDS